MFKDDKTGKDFMGSQNPWLKRLGLFIIIVACFSDYFIGHPKIFMGSLILIIASAIIWGILKVFASDIKDLFR